MNLFVDLISLFIYEGNYLLMKFVKVCLKDYLFIKVYMYFFELNVEDNYLIKDIII